MDGSRQTLPPHGARTMCSRVLRQHEVQPWWLPLGQKPLAVGLDEFGVSVFDMFFGLYRTRNELLGNWDRDQH